MQTGDVGTCLETGKVTNEANVMDLVGDTQPQHTSEWPPARGNFLQREAPWNQYFWRYAEVL